MSVLRCIAFVAVLAALAVADSSMTTPSALYSLSGLPNQIAWPLNVRWRLVDNAASAGGPFVAVRLFWKAGQYAAIGFSPTNMQGFITACNVPAMDPASAVCTDVIGYNGGGISKNPTQYSRLLWAKVQDAGFVEAEIEIPVSNVNISYAADGSTRLIFASSTWNSTTNMPEPHNGQNRMPVHVNLADGTVAKQSLPMATAASHILQVTADFSAWWFVVYNTTVETSYTIFNIALNNAQHYGGVGISNAEGASSGGFACHYDTVAVCKDVIDGKPATQTFTKIVSSSKSGGVGYITVSVALPAASPTFFRKTYFATGEWNKVGNFPKAPTTEIVKYVRFNGDELLASEAIRPFALFPGHYYATWEIVQNQKGFNQYNMRAFLEIKGDHYVGLGFANSSMGGPLVACHMPQQNALNVVCRDFIGQETGGVVANPEQSSKIVTAVAVGDGMTQIIVDIDLAKFNVSAAQAVDNFQRMIFAYGKWDATKNKPTYHGPNATFFQVNIFTGATNGSAPPTVAPAPGPATTTAAPISTTAAPTAYALKQTSCTDSACSVGCQSENLPTNQCLGLNGGQGSAIATCHPTQGTVSLQIFTAAKCAGASQTQTMPLNQCGNDGHGSVEDQCVPATGLVMSAGKNIRFAESKQKHNLNKF
jgi:hypothetical protein